MNIKTVTTTTGMNTVVFGNSANMYYWVKNIGSTDITVGATNNAENHAIVKPDNGICVDTFTNTVYINGAGTVEIYESETPVCPFKLAQRGGDITATGNPVQLDGLQGGVPFSEMVVSGKNLLLGIVDLYPTANGNLATNSNAVSAYAKCNPNTTYTIQRNGGSRLQCMATQALPSNGTTFSKATTAADQTANTIKYTTPDNCNYIVVYLTGTAEEITDIQIEEGSTATAYEPPITGQNITLWACKKNLMCYPYWVESQGGTLENNGVTYTLNADMSISANGTATADSYCILQHLTMSPNVNSLIKNTDYFLSGSPVGSGADTYQIYTGIYDNDGNRIEIYHDYGSGVSIKMANDYRCTASILIKKGQTVSNLIFRPQLELGSAATDYEMPSGTSYTITPDSNPYVIPNDIRQLDGLNNISVSEGEISVVGVRKNAAIKRIWEKMDELTTAIIVSNGESE